MRAVLGVYASQAVIFQLSALQALHDERRKKGYKKIRVEIDGLLVISEIPEEVNDMI